MPEQNNKRPLRICLISASYYMDENCGGLSSYYFHLNRCLRELGHTTYLITGKENRTEDCTDPVLVKSGWKDMVPGDGTGPVRRILSRFAFSYHAYRQLHRLDRRHNLDVIVAPELFAQGLIASVFLHRKLVTRIHAPTFLVDRYNETQLPWISKLLSFPEKLQAKRSLAITVASNHLASTISSLWNIPPSKIHVIPNTIQVDWVRKLGMEEKKEISGDYLLFFGRLEKLKGVHVLSQSLPEVFEARPDIKMIWIGRDCGWKNRILAENEKYSDRMIFFDTMPKERLFPILRHATLVILPSLFDNFPNAGLEAMALERPVIGTYRTGFAEMIQDSVDGFLVEPGSIDALKSKILSCVKRDDLSSIGREAYARVQQYDEQRMGPLYDHFFRTITDSSLSAVRGTGPRTLRSID